MSAKTQAISPWWKDKQNDVHNNIHKAVNHFVARDTRRRDDILFNGALYGDDHFLEAISARHRWERTRRDQSVTFNLVKSVVDTMASELVSNTPLPKFLTQKGRWELRRRAQNMELMCAGEYDRNNVDQIAANCFLDAAKFGDTAIKVCNEGGLPKIERVFPGEIVVDPVEAQFGFPRTLFQMKLLDKEVLRSLYGRRGKLKDAMDRAPLAEKTLFPWMPRETLVEQVLVIEAWRLPDPEDWPGAQKGRHAIAIETGTLLDEEWTRERFPIVTWRYDVQSANYYGRGAVTNLRAMQIEINYVAEKIQRCLHLSSGFRYLVEGNSKLDVEKVNNDPGVILRYFGAVPPQVELMQTVPEEFFRHMEDLIRRGFEQEGVSVLQATSQKPEGLDSGAALREMNSISSRRFGVKQRQFEHFIGVELAKVLVDEKRALAKAGLDRPSKVAVKGSRGVTVRTIKWADAAMEEESYGIRIFPGSALPNTPAGRIATVEQWFEAGFLSRDQALQLMDFPDLEDFTSLELSSREIVLDQIDQMLIKGKYSPPEPLQDLVLGLQLMQAAYLRSRTEGAPDDRLELLLRFMDDAQFLMDQAQQSQQVESVATASAAEVPEGAAEIPGAGPEALPAEAAAGGEQAALPPN